MRSLLVAIATTLVLTACASQSAPPAKEAAAPAPAATAAAPKAPQCYNGDTGTFDAVGTKASISGVSVACDKTADGKNAQWVGVKAKH